MRYLASLFTTALIVGLAGGVTSEAPFVLAVTLGMSAAWVLVVLGHLRRHAAMQGAAGIVLCASTGWMLGSQAVDRALHSPLRLLLEQRLGGFLIDAVERRADEPIAIEGRLVADAVLSEEGVVLRLIVTRVRLHGVWEGVAGGVSVGVGGAPSVDRVHSWRAGRLIRAPATLRRPARYLNDGLPDQERTLARRGISLVGSIKSAQLVELLAKGRWWEEMAATVRARTRDALGRHVAPRAPQSAAIATAIVIGDRTGLSAEATRRLQEAGTYHVIAISGGNIAILAGLLLGTMAALGLRGRVAALAAIAALVAYATIAAAGPSVLRATLMAVVYLAVRLIDQRTAAANAISVTAAGLLITNPLQIADVGFWFTFGATVALVLAYHAVPSTSGGPLPTSSLSGRTWTIRLVSVVRSLRRAFVLVLVGTIAVELALAPIAALVFGRVTVAGLALNFVALPAMTVVQVGALSVLLADWLGLGALAGWLAGAVHVGGVVLVESARLLDYAPWLTWRVPPPWFPVLAAYYVLGGIAVSALLWSLMPKNQVHPITAASLGLFLWIIVAPDALARPLGDGRLHVTMFDVGQGDSVLVTFPNGRRLLIDAGGLPWGTFDIGDRVVGAALRARRVRSLDYIAITHADVDHVGGAKALARDFRPHELWWGIPVANHELTSELRDEAARMRSSWRSWQRGDHMSIGGVDVGLLHPPPPTWERQRVRNNDSLVFELRFGRVSVLLTGDIGREVEDELLAGLDLLPTVVLKVPHHGSLTSSSTRFLDAARPDIALIGAGRGNVFGHPAPQVLGRLHDVGAEVFRTDLDGQLDVVTDGETVDVVTFTGRRGEFGR